MPRQSPRNVSRGRTAASRTAEYERFTKHSSGGKKLRELFESGLVTGDELPRNVFHKYPVFQRYSLDRFRWHFNDLRKKLIDSRGMLLTTNIKCTCLTTPKLTDLYLISIIGDQNLHAKNTDDVDAPTIKKGKYMFKGDDDDISLENASDVDDADDALEGNLFNPIHVLWPWNDPSDGKKHLSIAILMPTGVTENAYSATVTDGGKTLQLSVQWLDSLFDVIKLHKPWLEGSNQQRVQSYHPRLLSFKNALRDYRSTSTDSVFSTCYFHLPFQVQTEQAAEQVLGWKNPNTLIVYVTMKACIVDMYHKDESNKVVKWCD